MATRTSSTASRTKAFRRSIVPRLLAWHSANKRSFIWRGVKRSPYIVLVSEFMLQQTGTTHVDRRLPIFLKQFPSVKSLANATPAQVLRAWQGLGYNRRALYLHRAAKALAALRTFPKSLEALQKLPGVGQYTASAVLAFAYNADMPVIDVNVERVLSRLWKKMPNNRTTLPKKDLYEFDASVLPKGQSSAWHEALMDLGATICTKNAPKCLECPLRRSCPSVTMEHSSQKSARSEPHYFGEPRRIWRGRVLRTIANADGVATRTLTSTMEKRFEIEGAGFAPFIKQLVKTLVAEQFIHESADGTLILANE
ncbi:MAG: A/G-specific adenine glycosylase [Bacteroidota bacterium]|nr:A/G-specific adenine glycosylase [Bacteroidota bacterium]MDP4233440.1 A/G-specific adenine glycosylase [Bacteroidota bacterium]MDP4242306.1 A/G-specific adenine glycosylase [Bacteroidota bacterium]MDP4287062.1 A/G-specific adenine glycosylase [Bacteroidota bacterium]